MAEDPDRLKILVIRVALVMLALTGLGFGTNWVADRMAAAERAEKRAELQAQVEWQQTHGRALDSMYYDRLLTAEQHARRMEQATRAYEQQRDYRLGRKD